MLAASMTQQDQQITQELPPPLAARLTIETNGPLIANCTLFHVLDNGSLLELLTALTPCTIPPKQVVTREGQPCEAIYFIVRGIVRVTRKKRAAGSNFAKVFSDDTTTCTDHDYFGEDAMLDAEHHRSTVTAISLTFVDMMLLTRDKFDRVATSFARGGGLDLREHWRQSQEKSKSKSAESSRISGAGASQGPRAAAKRWQEALMGVTNLSASSSLSRLEA